MATLIMTISVELEADPACTADPSEQVVKVKQKIQSALPQAHVSIEDWDVDP